MESVPIGFEANACRCAGKKTEQVLYANFNLTIECDRGET